MEEQESRHEKKKWLTLVDGTIIALALTVVFVTLTYAYNGGYNYYFGIPQFFTTALWGGIVYRMPQISQIFIATSIAFIFFNYIKKWIMYAIRKKTKEINENIVFLIIISFMVLLLAASIYTVVKTKSASSIAISVMTIIELIYIVSLILKYKKFDKAISQSSSEKIKQPENERADEYFKKVTATYEDGKKFIEVRPSFKPFWISCVFMVYSLIFILFFLWGGSAAKKQTSFYFIDNETVISSVYEDNVLAVSVSYDQTTKKYHCTGEYKLIPQQNLTFKIVSCGTIISDIKQDEIDILFDLN